MIEIVNKQRGPVQLVVRSRTKPHSFTTLIIPGIGKGKNVRILEDEQVITEVINRVEKSGFISTRYFKNNEITKSDQESRKGE